MVLTFVFVVLNLTSCGDRPANRYREDKVLPFAALETIRLQDNRGYYHTIIVIENHRYLVGNANSKYFHMASCPCKQTK